MCWTVQHFRASETAISVRLSLAGHWTLDSSASIEAGAKALLTEGGAARRAILDLGGVARLDTAGAWLIDRTRQQLGAKGVEADIELIRPEFGILLEEAHYRALDAPRRRSHSCAVDLLADVGESVSNAGRDLLNAVGCLGEFVATLGTSLARPKRFRAASLVFPIWEFIALRGRANHRIDQFPGRGPSSRSKACFNCAVSARRSSWSILFGILILRELVVLRSTSIMVAGRSGSAITA